MRPLCSKNENVHFLEKFFIKIFENGQNKMSKSIKIDKYFLSNFCTFLYGVKKIDTNDYIQYLLS